MVLFNFQLLVLRGTFPTTGNTVLDPGGENANGSQPVNLTGGGTARMGALASGRRFMLQSLDCAHSPTDP